MLRMWLCFAAVIASAAQVQANILFDVNFSGASGGAVANIDDVIEAQFLASSVLGFNDLDGSGGISAGDTFTDYTMIRITGFTDGGGGNVTPLTYGSGPGRTHEITIKTSFSGVQTVTPTLLGPGAYIVTSMPLFEVYADFGAGFTGSNFFNLTTFTNTPLAGAVETGVLGGPSGGVTNGPTKPDGTIDVVVALSDLLHTMIPGQYFELDSATGNPLDTVGGLVLQGIFDANNLATPPGVPLGGLTTGSVVNGTAVVSGFDLAFGISGTQLANGTITSLTGFDFAFATRSDGSFVKQIVPEPGSLAIFGGIGLGLALVYSRRRRSA